jgi:hypothetical protein
LLDRKHFPPSHENVNAPLGTLIASAYSAAIGQLLAVFAKGKRGAATMRLSAFEFTVVLLVTLAVVAAARILSAPAGKPAGTADDSWRRTAQGWERTDSWQVPQAAAPATDRPLSACRFDTHPAAIALMQIVAAAAALAFFTNKPRPAPHGVQATILRSYRASFFGS